MKKRFFIFAILTLIQAVIAFEMMMVMSLAPILSKHYQISAANVAFLNIGYTLSGFFIPYLGFIGDRYGIKRILTVSSLLMTAGAGVVALNTIPAYCCGRFLLGIGAYALSSVIQSYTSILVEERLLGRIAGIYKLGFALAVFLAPTLALFIYRHYGLQTIYLLVSLVCLLSTLAIQLFPPVACELQDEVNLAAVKLIFVDTKARLMIIANVGITLPAVLFYTYASISMDGAGFPSEKISLFYSSAAIGSILAGLLITLFADKFGKWRLTYLTTFMAGIVMLSFLVVKFPLMLGFALLFGLAFDTLWGLFYPLCTGFYPHLNATFLTIMGMVTAGVNLFNNSVAPLLYPKGGFTSFIIICAVGLLVAGVCIYRAQQIFAAKK